MERTLLLIKPNAIEDNYIGAIISELEKSGLRILNMKMDRLTRERAANFYAVHRGKPFYERLLDFMTSGPIVEMVLEHPDAVAHTRAVIGNTDPAKAAPGTIRARFARSLTENAVHASDSPENAATEIKFMFGEEAAV